METNQEQKFDYKTLSLKKQYVWKLCKQLLRDLKNGECTDEQIDDLIARTEPRLRDRRRSHEDTFVGSEPKPLLRLDKGLQDRVSDL